LIPGNLTFARSGTADVFRKLTPAENPPTLERLLAAVNLQVVAPSGEKERYREIINNFTARGARLQEYPTEDKLKSASLIILGRKNRWIKPLLGETEPLECPVVLKVRPHPRSPNLLAAVFISAIETPPDAIEKLLAHPFFSSYCIKKENQFSRTLTKNQPGIQLQLHNP